MDSWVVIVWAHSCWRDGVGFVIASLSLTFGVVDLCGCLYYGGFRAVGRNSCSGIPRVQRYVGGLLHGAVAGGDVAPGGGVLCVRDEVNYGVVEPGEFLDVAAFDFVPGSEAVRGFGDQLGVANVAYVFHQTQSQALTFKYTATSFFV
ncbi:hypothetical protein NDU88_004311 [Pleurodeles waltl]|uniref:Uncharacterized protein n=1 Tax=Pleurodeles waltl TaxID=8319 RepID=A0AAV7M6S3_PLEWA|nr:hypothetical protein NDU88_004311 [Pleurodeles waltl]